MVATNPAVALFMGLETLKMKVTHFFKMSGTNIMFPKSGIQGKRFFQYCVPVVMFVGMGIT
jgi:hypothetical protein